MNLGRRGFLATCAATLAATAGCSGDGGSGDGDTPTPFDGTPTAATDGYPSSSVIETVPEPANADTDAFETTTYDGVTVPLVPIDVAYTWYRRREARFADARGVAQYDASHVTGAVSSPASGDPPTDPTQRWSTDDRIVTYCACPHHLSSWRASELIADGYTDVYALDEGFIEWRDRGYPTRGSAESLATYSISGRTDPADAGERALATHPPTDQIEATFVEPDGRYAMNLHFDGLTPDSPIRIETPSYAVTAPLETVTSEVVTGE